MSSWRRVPVSSGALVAACPGVRSWMREAEPGTHLTVIRTREQHEPGGPFLTHVSISHRTNGDDPQPGRYPTWDEQKEAVWRFAPGLQMASYLPSEDDDGYVNVHETTFHWWEVPASHTERTST
ncbi:hypothetical protein [Phycicoccus sp.]|uniref:hypothetical protein n=1 Tax=Phycicoccus sp. TaxID=1902410 RepID=UPI002D05BBEC|nr:hypothetical protein [Phycicoccus sp.]HMM95339.1 hypothetical protein [Phycicoccus sp.]